MIQIIPAILATTPEQYKKDIEKINNSKSFEIGWVHIDFADNKFVPNKSIDVSTVMQFPTHLKKEAHLMVERPLEWIDDLKKTGFQRVIFHFECSDDKEEVIESIKKAGMEVGIAINLDTPMDALESYKDKVDQILVMGIVPGFQGQPFIPDTIVRIRDLKSKGWPVKISIDGAVQDINARQLVEAGVDQLVIGSFLLKGEVDANVEKIREATSGPQEM